MKKRARRGRDEPCRREAVRLAESGTRPIAAVARPLGVHVETRRNWRREAQQRRGGGNASATVPSLEGENRRLRHDNARLLEERAILKSATTFFAKEAR